MRLKLTMIEKPSLVIFIAIASLLIICVVLLTLGFFHESEKYENEEVIENMTFDALNETINVELKQIELMHMVTKWELNDEQKDIIIYEVGMNDDQIAKLEEKTICGCNISVRSDIDYINEKRAAMAEIRELEKNPELQIAGYMSAADREEKTVIVWVYNRTPENEALDGKVIHGWKILIAGPN